jgi:two-component system sensor histidine kinase DegS
MNDRASFPSADMLMSDARLRLESWRAELQGFLTTAKSRYRETLKELESVVSSGVERADGSLASRLDGFRRSRSLQQTAAEFDTAISRLVEAQSCLDAAAEALEGKLGQLGPVGKPSEISLEAVAIQAQEEERYRLAREIHDGPAQILANVALQLEYISRLATKDPVRARDELVNIQRDLRLAVGEVRRFMYDLRPPALVQQGVGPAVESHCQRLAERFGLKISADWQSATALAPSHDTAVFRIVQEALQNVVKHSQATEVVVQATERDGFLEVSVIDNGKGFDADGVRRLDPKHFGLAGMRARAQQIGATLEVTSVPNQGTRVLIKVPLSA